MTLIERLKAHEGFRSQPYKDSRGFWTIGYGHLLTTDTDASFSDALRLSGGIWDTVVATRMLEGDIVVARDAIEQHMFWVATFSADTQDALVELAFNLGLDGLLRFKKMLSALKQGDRETACAELRDSRWYTQVGDARYKSIASLLQA